MTSTYEIGVVTLSMGCLVFVFGVIALFDSALMIAGNLLIIAGMVMLLRSKSFTLFELDKLLGTFIFVLGIVAMLLRMCLVGFLLEFCGLVYIFKKSMPSFRSVLFRLFRGNILSKSN